MNTARLQTFKDCSHLSVDKQRVAKGFDKAAKCYNYHSHIQKQVSQQALAILSDKLLIKRSRDNGVEREWLLDIGCGPAANSKRLSAFCDNAIGIDIAHAMLKEAKRNLGQNTFEQVPEEAVSHQSHQARSFLFSNCDAEELAIRSCSIDVIYSSMALQWCISPELTLQETYRVLKPKGTALLAIMVGESFSNLHNAFMSLGQPSRVNQFHSTNAWLQASGAYDWSVEPQLNEYISYHSSTLDMLRSIKQIGANTLVSNQDKGAKTNHPFGSSSFASKAYLSKQELKKLDQYFKRKYPDHSEFPLEYRVLYLSIQK